MPRFGACATQPGVKRYKTESMLAALTLVVLVATHEPRAEIALAGAAQTALGDHVSLQVQAVSPLPSDAELRALAVSLHADGVATVAWLDSSQRRAVIRLRGFSTRGWLERELVFSVGDVLAEQGRTLGFALASMLPASVTDAASDPRPELDAVPGHVDPAPGESRGFTRAPPESNTSIDATANAGVALGGAGDGFGGTLGTQVDLSSRFGLQFDLGVRAGQLERLEANTMAVDLAPGIAWRVLDRPWGSPFALELHLAFAARYLSVTREAGASDGAESHASWLPGLRVGTAGLWWLSDEWALLATAALDASSDETKIMRNGMRVASVEPFAVLMQLGVRARL